MNTDIMVKKNKSSFKKNNLIYAGDTPHVYKVWFVNIFLSIITFSIYSFWAKTRIRRYVVGSFTIGGDRVVYTGTGKELFFGFIKIIPILLILYVPLFVLGPESPVFYIILAVLIYLFSVAIYSTRRYRFSRMLWRGIRPKLYGSAFKYGFIYIWRTFLNVITLGVMIPFSDVKLAAYQMNNLTYGNLWFEYKPSVDGLVGVNIITLLLALPTLFMSRIWYRAALLRNKFRSIKIQNITFKFCASGWDLYRLMAINYIIIVFTLGLGKPIVLQRNIRFVVANLVIIGDIAALEAYQAEKEATTMGEGMDVIFGLEPALM